jgi:ketosteroid isomerase-like protein
LFGAITAGDVAAVRALYTDDTLVWHNHDRVAQSANQNLRLLEWMVTNVRELRYEEVQRQRTDRGFVQQHVLRGRLADGRELSVPACMVVTVESGHITRIDEYFDSAAVAPLFGG